MNTAEKVARLEQLLERVRKNRNLPRQRARIALAPTPPPRHEVGGAAAARPVAAPRIAPPAPADDSPEIEVQGTLATDRAAPPRLELVQAKIDHKTKPGMPAAEPPATPSPPPAPPPPSPPPLSPSPPPPPAESEPDAVVEVDEAEIEFAEEEVVAEHGLPGDEATMEMEPDSEPTPAPSPVAPSSALPSSALPTSALPSSALPTSALPSSGAPSSGDVVTARTPGVAPPPVTAQPAPQPPAEVELAPTPTPPPAEAVEVAAREGKIKLQPHTVAPERLPADDVGEFIGEVQQMQPQSFGELVDAALSLQL